MRGSSFLICAAAAVTAAPPAVAASAAEDVADISNRACLAIASGQLSLPHPALPEFEKTAAGLGLKAGIDRKSLDMFGPATSMISRAAMAHRLNGDSYVVLSTGGALQGCRVILLSEPSTGAMDAVAAALVRPVTGGWRAFPEMTGTRGPVT
jgi:opacity protein-like surface antigen